MSDYEQHAQHEAPRAAGATPDRPGPGALPAVYFPSTVPMLEDMTRPELNALETHYGVTFCNAAHPTLAMQRTAFADFLRGFQLMAS